MGEKVIHEYWSCDFCGDSMVKPAASLGVLPDPKYFICRRCAEDHIQELEAFIDLSDEGMVVNDGIRFQIQDAIRTIAHLKQSLSVQ